MNNVSKNKNNLVAFQGRSGANSEIALRKYDKTATPAPTETFAEIFSALACGEIERAFLPVENSSAGRVTDVHHLIPKANIFISGEHFEPIHHQFVILPEANLDDIKEVFSHIQALGQCQNFIKKHNLKSTVHADTAGAASDIALWQDKTKAAIAPALAAEIYGLKIIKENIEDNQNNTTRFLMLETKKPPLPKKETQAITTIIFETKNIPQALFQVLKVFAKANINMTKLESYMLNGSFQATQFYVDLEGNLSDDTFANTLEEIKSVTQKMKILGCYEASTFRLKN